MILLLIGCGSTSICRPCRSKYAEGSTKSKQAQKNRYGRQLARVHAPQYHETLFSRLHSGRQERSPAYIPTVDALGALLNLPSAQKQRTVLRSDAGFGSDANVNDALRADWQVLTKTKGGKRPQIFAGQVAAEDWEPLRYDRWLAQAVRPPTYERPTDCLVLRWLTPPRVSGPGYRSAAYWSRFWRGSASGGSLCRTKRPGMFPGAFWVSGAPGSASGLWALASGKQNRGQSWRRGR